MNPFASLRRLFSTPVSSLLRVNRRSSAAGLYILAAVILGLSAGCDVSSAAGQLRTIYAYQDAVSAADACVSSRLAEIPAFEKSEQTLEKDLRPFASRDFEAVFLQGEHDLRSGFPSVTFVHVDPPRSLEAALPTARGVQATPDPALAPISVAYTLSVADGCFGPEVQPSAAPSAAPSAGASAAPTLEPEPQASIFTGESAELEVRGDTDPTVAVARQLASIPVALYAPDVTFEVSREGETGRRVLDSKTRVILFCIATPSPAPTLDPQLLQSSADASPSPSASSTPVPSGVQTASPPAAVAAHPSPTPTGAVPCVR